MDLAAVTARVKMLGATTSRPAVSDADLTSILTAARRPDVDGQPIWDVNAAIAEVWAVKAARVAGDYNFTADDASFSKGDVLANMAAMEARYRAMADQEALARIGNASTLDVSRGGGRATLDSIAATVIP